jgi:hypothetical protein
VDVGELVKALAEALDEGAEEVGVVVHGQGNQKLK